MLKLKILKDKPQPIHIEQEEVIIETTKFVKDVPDVPEEIIIETVETVETIESLEEEIVRLLEERKSNQKNSNELIRQAKEKLALLINKIK